MLTRMRMIWIGAVAAIFFGAFVAQLAQWLSFAVHPSVLRDVALLYVGADDCPPCRAWQRDAGAAFRSSAEFTRVAYYEVKSPNLLGVLKDEYWPDELRRYRDRLDRRAGVPLWLVIADHEIVEQA